MMAGIRLTICLEERKGRTSPSENAQKQNCHDHNAPLQAIATLLGHAKLSIAQIYTRVSVGRMMQTYNAAHPHAKE
jgi:hypothetical protein